MNRVLVPASSSIKCDVIAFKDMNAARSCDNGIEPFVCPLAVVSHLIAHSLITARVTFGKVDRFWAQHCGILCGLAQTAVHVHEQAISPNSPPGVRVLPQQSWCNHDTKKALIELPTPGKDIEDQKLYPHVKYGYHHPCCGNRCLRSWRHIRPRCGRAVSGLVTR
jgi:hypothetical protein